jgi:protein-L-isoaspartate(D-aspartate) O-methyltransferase
MLNLSPSESRRDQLTRSLQASGVIQTACVAHAFQSVPREIFIERFYEPDGRGWKSIEKTLPEEQWLDRVYQDVALTTALNVHSLPNSSSSQPSIMAEMLEALDIQRGQRVLEIGTGTGYNAALLAELTQDPAKVTTIEVDAQIATRAARILHEHIGPVRVQMGDGRLGVPEGAPYDRIIATASSPSIPHPWYEQLAPDGCLVMPLEGSLQIGGFLVIKKDGDGFAVGKFRSRRLSFMAMHAQAEEVLPYPVLSQDYTQWPLAGKVQVQASDPLLLALEDKRFLWFLQWAWSPVGDLRISLIYTPEGKRIFRICDPSTCSILFLSELSNGSWAGRHQGETLLWPKIQEIYHKYQQQGAPEYEAFGVYLDEQRASLWVGLDEMYLRDLYRKPL